MSASRAVATRAQLQAMLTGTLVDMNAMPLTSATARLRNLLSKLVEHVTTTNQQGEFTFAIQPEVPYVVEILDGAGRVVAVGDVVIAQAGDVAAVRVTGPTRLAGLAGTFGDTAGSIISAAAGSGVTVAPKAPPLSPEK
jgi:hypothetical protein